MPSLVRNLKLSILTFISQIISGSVVYIILARVMSLSDFGLLSFGATFAGLITVVAEFGFSLMAQRDIPQNRFPFNDYIFNAFIQKVGFSAISIIGGVIYLTCLYSAVNVTVGLIFLVNAIITSNNMYLFSVFRAKNMFKYESWLSMLYAIFLSLIIALFFIFKFNVLFVAVSLVIARFIQLAILSYLFLRKFGWPRIAINRNIQSYFFKNSYSFGAHYIIGIFYFTIDSQLIFYYSGHEALAIYQSFFKIVLILLSVNELLNNIFIPYLSSRICNGDESFKEIASVANKVIITLGLFLFVFINLFAKDIIHILYSDKYMSAISIVIPLSFVLLFRIIASIYAVLLTVSEHQNIRVIIVLSSLLINTSLNIWLIPKYGFVGAAYVSMLTHLVLVSMYVLFAYRFIDSFLVDSNILLYFISTVSFIVLKQILNIEFHYLFSFIIILVWGCSLFLVYNRHQLNNIKKIFIGKYI